MNQVVDIDPADLPITPLNRSKVVLDLLHSPILWHHDIPLHRLQEGAAIGHEIPFTKLRLSHTITYPYTSSSVRAAFAEHSSSGTSWRLSPSRLILRREKTTSTLASGHTFSTSALLCSDASLE